MGGEAIASLDAGDGTGGEGRGGEGRGGGVGGEVAVMNKRPFLCSHNFYRA